ncbi:transmembrane protein, putative (macronuclear) [Tetrahymena thermophila SB210]|uniref:Transmembrane protein, putative n=1 Tax=Tetrahymena thermophila (strain SB210) TaxID=312017 RepID=W7XCX9_TETTS|nr:transmembrane protein, putative [Tetrahymena thermophila SB210]EWS71666.1 transmembrane protein, putative [Tetrahymena thermophila SB210]|eukprot:XP_012655798.1 transmembrane protein, putative [Tetrahymena thermophila SB210]
MYNKCTKNENYQKNNYSRMLLQDELNSIVYVNPLKKEMYPEPFQQDTIQKGSEEPTTIFMVPKSSTVDIIFDLRHVQNQIQKSISFSYGKDWDIAISTSQSFTLGNWTQDFESNKIDLPESFLNSTNQKTDSHKFVLFAYEDMHLMIFIRILKIKFSSLSSLFIQTTSVHIQTPYRASMKSGLIFPFILWSNSPVNLPLNLPEMVNPNQDYPLSIVSYTTANPSQHNHPINLTQSSAYTYYINNDRYWKNLHQLVIPYLPYFTNCKNYGQFIYLHQIIENHELCHLVDPKDTEPIKQISFQQEPVSDQCEDLKFECIMDDAFYSSNALPKLYQLPKNTNLFYMSANPVDIQDISVDGLSFKKSELIPVVSLNQVPANYLPASIELAINYYQVDKYHKKIIKCEMEFKSLINKETLSQQSNFTYELRFSFHSMSHAELAIAFALDYPIYLILSCIIGLFSIAMICIYFAFYKIGNFLTRRKIKTSSNYFFLSFHGLKELFQEVYYHLTLYPPIIKGIVISFFPKIILFTILSVLMIGTFWGYTIIGCSSLTDDYLCENSLFEILFQENIAQETRRGRLGISLVVIGFYICVRMAIVFIPDTQEDKIQEEVTKFTKKNPEFRYNIISILKFLSDEPKLLKSESYDGNIWRDKVWSRGLFIFITILVLVLMVIILYLSFSVYYATNIWMFIFILKITQIIIEEGLKVYVENELLLGSLSCVMTMINTISGLGAENYFAYLVNVFVALGIMCFEKVSQVLIVKQISRSLFKASKILNKWIEKQFITNDNEETEENDEEDETNDINSQQEKEEFHFKKQENIRDDISEIVLTEIYEESFGSIEDDEAETVEVKRQSLQIINSIGDVYQDKLIEINKQQQLTSKVRSYSSNSVECNSDQLQDQFEILFQHIFDKKFMKNYKRKERQESLTEDEDQQTQKQKNLEKEEKNKQVKVFTDFCYKSLNILELPIQTAFLWLFYDSNQIFTKWNITKEGLVFYFLFSIFAIPFQICVDILFIKTVEQYHGVCIKDYVKSVKERYINRKFNWKADDTSDALNYLEKEYQYIDAWCFSSQLFFCYCIFLAGSISIVQGAITIINNQYNFLGDQKLTIIIIIWVVFCFLVERLCFFFYEHSQIWKKDQKFTKKIPKTEEEISLKQQAHEQILSIQNFNSPNITRQLHNQNTFRRQEKIEMDLSPLQVNSNKEPMTPNQILSNIDPNKLKYQNTFFAQKSPFQFARQTSSRENFNKKSDDRLFTFNQGVLSQSQFQTKQSILANQYTRKFSTFNKNTINSNPTIQKFFKRYEQNLYDEELEYEDFFKETAKEINKNIYLKMYLDREVENAYEQSILVHSFILENLSEQKMQTSPLADLTNLVIQKFKYSQNSDQKRFQWESYKKNFKKVKKYKERVQKLSEKKIHLLNHEYKDEKFLQKFIKRNQIWIRKNINIMFDDLIKGVSQSQLPLLRNHILEGFNQIYGDIKQGSDNQVKSIVQDQITKQEAQKYIGTYVHYILRYWRQRSTNLQIAQNVVGGYLLKTNNSQNCEYCNKNWGLQVQTKENVEDLFNIFYKNECRRIKFYFNVVQLFEKDCLVIDKNTYKRDKERCNTLKSLKFIKFQDPMFQEDFNESNENNILDNSKDFDDTYNNDKSYDDQQIQLSSQQEINSYQQRRKNSKQTAFFVEHQNLSKEKLSQIMNKKKFIERWQEFFFKNATFVSVCFQCNEEAMEQFIYQVQRERKIKEQEDLLLKQYQQHLVKLNEINDNNILHELEEQDKKDIEYEKIEEFGSNYKQNSWKKKDQKKLKGTTIIEEDFCERVINEVVNEVKEDEEDDTGYYNNLTMRVKSFSSKPQRTSLFNIREKADSASSNKVDNVSSFSPKHYQSLQLIKLQNIGFDQQNKNKDECQSHTQRESQDIQQNQKSLQTNRGSLFLNAKNSSKEIHNKSQNSGEKSFNHKSNSSSSNSSENSSSENSSDSESRQQNDSKLQRKKSIHLKSNKSFKSHESKTHPLTSEQLIKSHSQINNSVQRDNNNNINNNKDKEHIQLLDPQKILGEYKLQKSSNTLITSNNEIDASNLNNFIENPSNLNQIMSQQKKIINFNNIQQSNYFNNITIQKTENAQTEDFFFQSARNISQDYQQAISSQNQYIEEVLNYSSNISYNKQSKNKEN